MLIEPRIFWNTKALTEGQPALEELTRKGLVRAYAALYSLSLIKHIHYVVINKSNTINNVVCRSIWIIFCITKIYPLPQGCEACYHLSRSKKAF